VIKPQHRGHQRNVWCSGHPCEQAGETAMPTCGLPSLLELQNRRSAALSTGRMASCRAPRAVMALLVPRRWPRAGFGPDGAALTEAEPRARACPGLDRGRNHRAVRLEPAFYNQLVGLVIGCNAMACQPVVVVQVAQTLRPLLFGDGFARREWRGARDPSRAGCPGRRRAVITSMSSPGRAGF
jgi:hypothetical protein